MSSENGFLDNILNVWSEVVREGDHSVYEASIEQSILNSNFFQIGDYFYVIYNVPAEKIEQVSPSVTSILGYQPSEYTLQNFFTFIHPDDFSSFADCQKTIAAFFSQLKPEKLQKYKSQFDFRVRKTNGEYLRFLVQSFIIQKTAAGGMVRVLILYTDVTHLKTSNKMSLSFIGLDGEPSYIDVPLLKNDFAKTLISFTKRELDVLTHLVSGKNSVEIAEVLGISKFTVDTHRKNLLTKAGCSSTIELINMSNKLGWV